MLALQEEVQGVPVDHPVMLWMIERAGVLLTTHSAGRDGRAPFKRLFGKRCREDGYDFGELGHCRARPTESERSLGACWASGVWLGRWWDAGAR
eukprot:8681333-Alexandrium_andersonii.AAC.1